LFTAMVRTALPGGVCWRSRRDNVVNKWYFERARGSWELPAAEGEAKNWTMFWTTEGVERDRELWQRYVSVCAGVVPSWADGAAE
jgi:amino-acid N-acetyltransferase